MNHIDVTIILAKLSRRRDQITYQKALSDIKKERLELLSKLKRLDSFEEEIRTRYRWSIKKYKMVKKKSDKTTKIDYNKGAELIPSICSRGMNTSTNKQLTKDELESFYNEANTGGFKSQ